MFPALTRADAQTDLFRPRFAFERRHVVAALALLATVLTPANAFACACGCAVFDVGTSSLLPTGPGATVFLEYDFLDQTKNWAGNNQAPAANNTDKEIRSNFLVAGGQYMFNSDWGVMAELPYTNRYFRTSDPGDPGAFEHGALGDIRLMGVYSGFSADMSTGLIFGVKLPTGNHTYPNFDADVEIGSGSTDVLLGGYHAGSLTADRSFGYFTQVLFQHEIATQYAYRPGYELNGAAGVSYNDIMLGDGFHVAPIVQLVVSTRGRDGDANGDPADSGYSRLLVAPGIELDRDAWKLYADVEVPVYDHVNGNQLAAPAALKFIASYSL
ncbi:MAG: hypothetical protein ABSC92_02120 [Rhizomicrobium sp.]|jgi:hypothetical protein